MYAGDKSETAFEGLARVAVADGSDSGPAAAVFLAAIDAEELEHAALARPDLGTGPRSLTAVAAAGGALLLALSVVVADRGRDAWIIDTVPVEHQRAPEPEVPARGRPKG